MSINPRSTYSVCKTSRVQRGIHQNSDWRDPRFIILLIDSRAALATWMVLYITKSPFGDFEFDAITRNLPSRVNVAVDAPLNTWSAPLEKKRQSVQFSNCVRLPQHIRPKGGTYQHIRDHAWFEFGKDIPSLCGRRYCGKRVATK